MRKLTVLCALVCSMVLMTSVFGCRSQNRQDVVEVIQIFKGRLQTAPPNTQIMVLPSANWDSGLPINPYPNNVQGLFKSGDKIYLGLKLIPNTKVIFSRYTFFNRGTSKEVEIGGQQTGKAMGVPPEDLGPFDGQAFPFFNNPLWVPDEPGIYEIRVYRNNKVVASAVFEVKME